MKYSQYQQSRELFESDLVQSYGYDINEWDSLSPEDKTEQLNEILGIAGLTTAILGKIGLGAAAGLLGVGIAFRKRLISAGVKKIQLRKLKKAADKFKETALAGLKKALAPLIKAKIAIKADAGVESWKELPKDKKLEVFQIEKKIEKVLSQYVTRVRQLKSEEINKKIDNSKRLSDSARSSLKYAWETMSTEVETGLLAELMKDKVIESPQIVDVIDKNTKKEEEELKKKMAEFEQGQQGKKAAQKGETSTKEESDEESDQEGGEEKGAKRKEMEDKIKDDNEAPAKITNEDPKKKVFKVGEKYEYKTEKNNDWTIAVKEVRSNGDIQVYNIETPKKTFAIKKDGPSAKRIGKKVGDILIEGKEYEVDHKKLGGKVKVTIKSSKDGKVIFTFIDSEGEEKQVTIDKKGFDSIRVKEEEKVEKPKEETKGDVKGKKV